MTAAARQARRCGGAAPAGLVLLALATLTACNTNRPRAAPTVALPQPVETVKAPPAPNEAQGAPPRAAEIAPRIEPAPPAAASMPQPACICSQPAPKPRPKHKVRKKVPVKQAEPASVGPEPPAATAVVNAEVGRIDGPLTSILGKNVYSPKGEDLGRVVDLLADPDGRVRVAIIDFGGFLGVGTRRIAVDWPLLHFSPTDKDKPLILTVTREKLQSAPEYKDSTSPRVLMPPAAAPDAAGAGTKK
jgi:hypothetical protein